MKILLFVGLGGFLGAIFRFSLQEFFSGMEIFQKLPLSTIFINIAGSFLIGLAAGFFDIKNISEPAIRVFLFAGFLGSFTTFSTFSYDTIILFKQGFNFVSLLHLFLVPVLGVLFALFGLWLAKILFN